MYVYVSAEKTKLMTNSADDIQRVIKVKGAEAGYRNKTHTPGSSSLNDCKSCFSFYKAVANLDR